MRCCVGRIDVGNDENFRRYPFHLFGKCQISAHDYRRTGL